MTNPDETHTAPETAPHPDGWVITLATFGCVGIIVLIFGTIIWVVLT